VSRTLRFLRLYKLWSSVSLAQWSCGFSSLWAAWRTLHPLQGTTSLNIWWSRCKHFVPVRSVYDAYGPLQFFTQCVSLMVPTCLDPYYAFMMSQSLLDDWGFFSYSFIPRHQVQLSCPSVLLFVPAATRPEREAEDIRLKLCTRKEPSYPSQLFSLFAVSLPPN